MDEQHPTANHDDAHLWPEAPYRPETADERQRRIAHEAVLIAEARAAAAAGDWVSEAEVDAWIDSLDTDHELPPPQSKARRERVALAARKA